MTVTMKYPGRAIQGWAPAAALSSTPLKRSTFAPCHWMIVSICISRRLWRLQWNAAGRKVLHPLIPVACMKTSCFTVPCSGSFWKQGEHITLSSWSKRGTIMQRLIRHSFPQPLLPVIAGQSIPDVRPDSIQEREPCAA